MARRIFIDAVARLVPEALDELAALANQLPDHDSLMPPGPEIFAREQPLRAWCVRRGFTAVRWAKLDPYRAGAKDDMPLGRDWLLELARWTARLLRSGHEPLDPASVMRMSVSVSFAPVDAPPLSHPVWDSDVEPERAFRARVDAYIRDIKQRTAAAGRVPARRLKNPQRDFDWLALYQVGRLEAVEIRPRYPLFRISPAGILDAITVAATQAGVHLRPARRGRPRQK